jgi:hypothetical protein
MSLISQLEKAASYWQRVKKAVSHELPAIRKGKASGNGEGVK